MGRFSGIVLLLCFLSFFNGHARDQTEGRIHTGHVLYPSACFFLLHCTFTFSSHPVSAVKPTAVPPVADLGIGKGPRSEHRVSTTSRKGRGLGKWSAG